METVNVKINGRDYSVPANVSVLEAARYAGIDIPTLCYLKEINEISSCRICLVEATGARGLVASCVYPVAEGMEIRISSPGGALTLGWRFFLHTPRLFGNRLVRIFAHGITTLCEFHKCHRLPILVVDAAGSGLGLRFRTG